MVLILVHWVFISRGDREQKCHSSYCSDTWFCVQEEW